jgi:hypothetical protein
MNTTDLHVRVASLLYEVDAEDVTSAMRQAAKVYTFNYRHFGLPIRSDVMDLIDCARMKTSKLRNTETR